jgi:hypothetical protein
MELMWLSPEVIDPAQDAVAAAAEEEDREEDDYGVRVKVLADIGHLHVN